MSKFLFDAIQDPLFIVNAAGKVVFANAAALPLIQGELAELPGHPSLALALADLRTGRRTGALQVEMRVAGSGAQEILATAVRLANGPDCVVVLRREGWEAEYRNAVTAFLELVRDQLVDPMRRLAGMLADTPGAPTTGEAAPLADEVAAKLLKLLDLVEVFGGDALVGTDRVLMPELVREVLAELAPVAKRERINLRVEGVHDGLAPVYGGRDWLRRALRESVENACVHARAGTQAPGLLDVVVRARQTGEFLLIHVVNQGTSQALPSRLGRPSPFQSASKTAADPASAGNGLKIGLSLAQRIVELHDGNLRLRENGDGDVELIIELPTGGPRKRDTSLDALQAQRYAQDLAALLAQRRARATGSGPNATGDAPESRPAPAVAAKP